MTYYPGKPANHWERWTRREDEVLKQFFYSGVVHERLHRTARACARRFHWLGYARRREHTEKTWTIEEIIALKSWTGSYREFGEKYGRSKGSVAGTIWRLKYGKAKAHKSAPRDYLRIRNISPDGEIWPELHRHFELRRAERPKRDLLE